MTGRTELPDGWVGEEAESLRFGPWRFYRVVDVEGRSDVREDNLPVRDGEPSPGEPGLRRYLDDLDPLDDPQRLPAETVAAQVGHFVIRGDSRQSAYVRVAPDPQPSQETADGVWRLRATYVRDGYRRELRLELRVDGALELAWGEVVPTRR